MSSGQSELANYTLNEPFEVSGKWYKLVNLDIIAQTIQLISLPENEPVYGYKKGYFVDLESLKTLCLKSESDDFESINDIGEKHVLLYFWGTWCAPCIHNIEAHAELTHRLSLKDSVTILNFPFLLMENDRKMLAELTGKSDVDPIQIIQHYEKGYYPENTEQDQPQIVLDLLKVSTFPEYILLDRTGKILFRGNNKNRELQLSLRAMGFL